MQHASDRGRTAAEGTESPRAAASAPSGCVLLSAPGAPAPDALRAAFAKRGLTPIDAADRFGAFSAMLRAAEAAGVLTGHGAGRGVVLVIVEPGRHAPGVMDGLLASVEKYLPRAAVRAFEAGAAPALHAIERPAPAPEVVVRGDAVREAESHLRNGAARPEPTLRLHRDDDAPSEAPSSPNDDTPDDVAESLLSPEELNMLLADDEGGAEGGRHR